VSRPLFWASSLVYGSRDLSSWLPRVELSFLWVSLLVVWFIPVLYFVSVEGFTFSVVEGIVVIYLEVLLFFLCGVLVVSTCGQHPFGGLYFGKTIPQSILTEIKP
jgi:hypothetical protein